MAEQVTPLEDGKKELGSATKNRTRFQQVLQDCVRAVGIDLQCNVLIVGGSYEDVGILRAIGFRRMALTNLQEVANFKLPQMDGVELNNHLGQKQLYMSRYGATVDFPRAGTVHGVRKHVKYE